MKKSTMKLSGVYIFWEYAKKIFKLNVVLVIILVLKGLYCVLLREDRTGLFSSPDMKDFSVCIYMEAKSQSFIRFFLSYMQYMYDTVKLVNPFFATFFFLWRQLVNSIATTYVGTHAYMAVSWLSFLIC